MAPEQAKLLAQLNPDKFYVENVRSIMGISRHAAIQICETAVRQEIFEQRIEVLCPDGSVAASADTESHLPETVECHFESDGFIEIEVLPTSKLKRETYYRFNSQIG